MRNVRIAGFIDVETTGLDPEVDEIIELSIVLFSFDSDTGEIIEILDEYTGLRDPSVPIKRAASEIHGIYKRHVKGKTLDLNRLENLVTQCHIIIAHNARFDKGFLDAMGLKIKGNWYCSMDGIPWKTEYQFRSKGLQNLLEDHGIIAGNAHRAADDVKAAITLLSKKNSVGTPYLKVLLDSGPINQRRRKPRANKDQINNPDKEVKKKDITLNQSTNNTINPEVPILKPKIPLFTQASTIGLVFITIIGVTSDGLRGFVSGPVLWFIIMMIIRYKQKIS